MKKRRIFGIVCVLLAFVMFSDLTALAVSDYEHIYTVDYMDEIERYDTGEFMNGITVADKDIPDKYYIDLLNDLGIYMLEEDYKAASAGTALNTTTESYSKYSSNIKKSDVMYVESEIISGNTSLPSAYKSNTADDPYITMYDTLSEMENTLGFEKFKDSVGVEKIATDCELKKNLSYSADKYMTFGDFAVLIWNTLNAYGMDGTYEEGKLTYGKADEILLKKQFDIYKVKGFVNAIGEINIYKNSVVPKNEIEIDRVRYDIGKSNAASYFGNRVVAYVRDRDAYDPQILNISADTQTTSVTIDFADLDSVSDTSIKYYDGGTQSKNINIKDLTYILFNGDAIRDLSVISDFRNMDGKITISASESGGNYDCLIINSYSYFVVYSVDTYDEKVNLKNSAEFNGLKYLDFSKDSEVHCTRDGKAAFYSDLISGDTIKVLMNSSGTYIVIDASSQNIRGKITNIDNDDRTVTVDNTEYRIPESYLTNAQNTKLTNDLYGTFYISSDKYIAGYKSVNEANYAYLKNIYKDDADDSIIRVEMYTRDSKWESMLLKKKITLDGKNGVKAEDAYTDIVANKIKGTVVRYKANESDEITFLDTLTDAISESTDKNRMKQAYEGDIKMSWYCQWFRSDIGYRVRSDTVVFQVPKNTDLKDRYSVSSGSSLSKDEQTMFMTLYNADDYGICDLVVTSESQGSVGVETPYWFYCESMGSSWDVDEDEEYYLMKGKRMKIGANETSDYSLKVSPDDKAKFEETYPGAIAAGTLMCVVYNSDDVVTAISVAFTKGILPAEYNAADNTSYYQHFCGTVTGVDTEQGYVSVQALAVRYVMPIYTILCIDSSDLSCRIISVGDLTVGEKMYAYRGAGWGRICAVVR